MMKRYASRKYFSSFCIEVLYLVTYTLCIFFLLWQLYVGYMPLFLLWQLYVGYMPLFAWSSVHVVCVVCMTLFSLP